MMVTAGSWELLEEYIGIKRTHKAETAYHSHTHPFYSYQIIAQQQQCEQLITTFYSF